MRRKILHPIHIWNVYVSLLIFELWPKIYYGKNRYAPSVTGATKGTLLIVNKNLNGKPVAMAEVFLSMSELNVMQHLSGL